MNGNVLWVACVVLSTIFAASVFLLLFYTIRTERNATKSNNKKKLPQNERLREEKTIHEIQQWASVSHVTESISNGFWPSCKYCLDGAIIEHLLRLINLRHNCESIMMMM